MRRTLNAGLQPLLARQCSTGFQPVIRFLDWQQRVFPFGLPAVRIEFWYTLMTLTEKILARASGRSQVAAGENVWVNADILLTHDVCGPGSIGVFKREFGQNAKVWDPTKIVIIPDHYIFTADRLSNRNVDVLREFAKEQGLPYFYDVIDDPNGHWAFNAARGQIGRQHGARYQGCLVTRHFRSVAIRGPARCFSGLIRTPVWRVRLASLRPESEIPTPGLSWGPANS